MQTSVLKDRIFLSSPHMSGSEMKYIEEAFQTNWITSMGPNIDAFEAELANIVGSTEAVAVSSGTAAIHLALSLLNVTKGDKVFCSSLTFVASANPILYQGAEPVFIDSEPETWNMSPIALERAFRDAFQSGELPKAVIIVNLYGQPAKMNELIAICNHYQVPIIEDAAESLGAMYQGKASGTFGDIGIYSFNGNKIITSSGGGMLVSNNKELLKKARFLASQAKDDAPHYQHSVVGYNYRMSNILAGIGRSQLEYLTHRVETRRGIFKRYFEELNQLPGLNFMPELANTRSNRWLTSFTLNENEAKTSVHHLISCLAEENIEARPVWKPLHSQPLFQESRYYPHKLEESVSDQLFKNGICLPSGSNMTEDEQTRVIDVIQNTLQK